MKTLIKNGTIVNADSTRTADLLIENDKIIAIDENITTYSSHDKVIDASGLYIFPGGIDPHVHMNLPTPAGFSADNFLTGSRAALHGGTTTIIDFVTPKKGQPLSEAKKLRENEAKNSITNCYFHVSPIEWRNTMEDEIINCFKHGTKSFKVYMAYKNSIGIDDDVLLKVMKAVAKAGGIVTVHCELGDEIETLRNNLVKNGKTTPEYHPISRPPQMEALAVQKAIQLASEANCPLYIVHVSAKESIDYIQKAQAAGQSVMAETCPQYLLLDDSKYIGNFNQTAPNVMSPPLRKKDDNDALWNAIADGTISTLGTDHCPTTLKQKQFGINDFRLIPNGAGGVEYRLSLLYTFGVLTGKITINKFVELISTNPARIFGLYPAKGIISVGSDADIVVWNPDTENTISAKTQFQNCDINIYEGFLVKGTAEYVFLAGELVIEQ